MISNDINPRKSPLKKRLYLALPLIPAFTGLCFFIAILSPLSWNDKGAFNPLVGVIAIGLGIVCAYCIAAFVETLKVL